MAYKDRGFFWRWLFKGNPEAVPPNRSDAGYKLLLDRWLLLHITVGAVLAIASPDDLSEAANSFLLPLAGIFIGIAVAWAANVHALLQSREMEILAGDSESGFRGWVYEYQLAVLILLTCLVAWGVAALEIFDDVGRITRFVAAISLFSLASLALQWCWRSVKDTQNMLVARKDLRDIIAEAAHHRDRETGNGGSSGQLPVSEPRAVDKAGEHVTE